MGYDTETIPHDLCCLISLEIMDKPVYDRKNPKIKFEEKNILEWLKTKKTHPVTKTSLTAEDLVNDTELEKQISSYINYCRQYVKNETFCGLKPAFLMS